jgi:cell division protein FtsX
MKTLGVKLLIFGPFAVQMMVVGSLIQLVGWVFTSSKITVAASCGLSQIKKKSISVPLFHLYAFAELLLLLLLPLFFGLHPLQLTVPAT